MNNSTFIPLIKTTNTFPNNLQAVQTLALTYPSARPILQLTRPVVLRTPQWTHYLLTGLDSLPAPTGMYFNLITHRTTCTYNNETTTHNTPHNHTQPTHTETYLYNTTHCYSKIPTRGDNITLKSAPKIGYMVARNMLSK
jgi:hypothetical protein